MDLGRILTEERIKSASIRSLFTKFNKQNHELHEYYFDTLKIVNAFTLRLGDSFYRVNLYIQRTEYRDDIPTIHSTITMTDLKPYWGWGYRIGKNEPVELVKEAGSVLAQYINAYNRSTESDFTLPFVHFIAISAQSHSDSKYQYGHTKTYVVIGAQYILE